jgi:hypothetical protein
MQRFHLHTPETAQWHALISEAQATAQYTIKADTENYLVMMLMRFMGKSEVAAAGIAPILLNGLLKTGYLSYQSAQDVGDQCLIIAGLFPENAYKFGVPLSYFVCLGRSAYRQLAHDRDDEFFNHLGDDFIHLIDVLLNMRELELGYPSIGPIQAHDLFVHTSSRHALKVLHKYTKSIPTVGQSRALH